MAMVVYLYGATIAQWLKSDGTATFYDGPDHLYQPGVPLRWGCWLEGAACPTVMFMLPTACTLGLLITIAAACPVLLLELPARWAYPALPAAPVGALPPSNSDVRSLPI